MYHLTGLMVRVGFRGAEGIGISGEGLSGVCGRGDSESESDSECKSDGEGGGVGVCLGGPEDEGPEIEGAFAGGGGGGSSSAIPVIVI